MANGRKYALLALDSKKYGVPMIMYASNEEKVREVVGKIAVSGIPVIYTRV